MRRCPVICGSVTSARPALSVAASLGQACHQEAASMPDPSPWPAENVAPLSRFDYDTVDDDNDHTAVGSYCR
jgi:hypothetical protein